MRHVACVAHDKTGVRSLRFDVHERPLSYQIAANSVDYIDAALDKILAKGVDILDLNVGCPAKNVIHTVRSALMGDLPRLKAIVTRLREKRFYSLDHKNSRWIQMRERGRGCANVARLWRRCDFASSTVTKTKI